MRQRALLICCLALFAAPAFAKDVFLSIGGSVGVFRTDMRIFNPSSTADIQIQASLLPIGNIDNSGVMPKSITVPKRQMVVFDDVVSSLFNGSGLAAIRLTSSDDFVATQRIFAVQSATAACNISGTLGQFVQGVETGAALKQGVLIQLKSNSSFRTNLGAVNPNNVTANVTWRLYDKNNALIATGNPIAMLPFGVIGPTNMASTFFFNPGSADLSDAWVSFTSDQPLIAYASVIDNFTTDPTFIPMSPDTTAAPSHDTFLSIGGSVGVFRTDMRIFNPSNTKDIQVQASLLPVGDIDNSGVTPKSITVPKRQMLVFDDVVSSLFNGSGLAAIRLSSSDDFVATQRIFAVQSASAACNISGTLGQFVPGLDTTAATKQGVLIQLKSNSSFRTNIGAVNPNNVTANVTWRLYDKNNALIATGSPITMPPFAVIQPTNMASTFFFNPGSANLSDAWVSFTSDQPLIAYASVIDNFTTDPTFIPMAPDTGTVTSPPIPTGKVFNVTEQNWSITISPVIGVNTLAVGDVVTFHITVKDSPHGFLLGDPDGLTLVSAIFSPGDVVDKTFTITKQGTFSYVCANPSCGDGHYSMFGSFTVGQDTNPGNPHYKR